MLLLVPIVRQFRFLRRVKLHIPCLKGNFLRNIRLPNQKLILFSSVTRRVAVAQWIRVAALRPPHTWAYFTLQRSAHTRGEVNADSKQRPPAMSAQILIFTTAYTYLVSHSKLPEDGLFFMRQQPLCVDEQRDCRSLWCCRTGTPCFLLQLFINNI